jgi:hypothetical protein
MPTQLIRDNWREIASFLPFDGVDGVSKLACISKGTLDADIMPTVKRRILKSLWLALFTSDIRPGAVGWPAYAELMHKISIRAGLGSVDECIAKHRFGTPIPVPQPVGDENDVIREAKEQLDIAGRDPVMRQLLYTDNFRVFNVNIALWCLTQNENVNFCWSPSNACFSRDAKMSIIEWHDHRHSPEEIERVEKASRSKSYFGSYGKSL